MALPDMRVDGEWPTPDGSSVVFDGKLGRYARTDLQGTVRVWRAGRWGRTLALPAGLRPGELGLSFSPDGGYLAVADATHWRPRLASDRDRFHRILDEPADHADPSPDSRQVAQQQPDGAPSAIPTSLQWPGCGTCRRSRGRAASRSVPEAPKSHRPVPVALWFMIGRAANSSGRTNRLESGSNGIPMARSWPYATTRRFISGTWPPTSSSARWFELKGEAWDAPSTLPVPYWSAVAGHGSCAVGPSGRHRQIFGVQAPADLIRFSARRPIPRLHGKPQPPGHLGSRSRARISHADRQSHEGQSTVFESRHAPRWPLARLGRA